MALSGTTDVPDETMAPFTGYVPTVTPPPFDKVLEQLKQLSDSIAKQISYISLLGPLMDLIMPGASTVLSVLKTTLALVSQWIQMILDDHKAEVRLSVLQNTTAKIGLCEATVEYQARITRRTLNDVTACQSLAENSKLSLLQLRNEINQAFDSAMSHFDNISFEIAQILDSVESLKHDIVNSVERARVHIREEKKRANVERILSRLNSLYSFFIAESKLINSLPLEQRLEILERESGISYFMDTALLGDKPGTMYRLLKDIVTDNLAIPASGDDQLALSVLRLLCFGVQMYSLMMMFQVQQSTLLAKTYYSSGDLKKFTKYSGDTSSKLKDHTDSLNDLLNQVAGVLDKAQDSIDKNGENADFDTFANATLKGHEKLRESMINVYETYVSQKDQVPGEVDVHLYFTEITQVLAPINDWKADSRVGYAVQLMGNSSVSTLVSLWSSSPPVAGYASPVVYLGTDHLEMDRVVFRQIDDGKPQMVAILLDSNFTVFTDTHRDLYNSAQEPNRELSLRNTKIYLEQGAVAGLPFEEGYSALHWAAENNNWDVANELIKNGSNVEVYTHNGFTPLYIASQKGYVDFVRNLLEHGANVSATANEANRRFTPLHTAASNGFDDIVQLLIKHASIDLNARSVEGFTPLHYAATFNQDKVAAALLGASGIDTEVQCDELMLTPLHVAAIHDSDKVAQILIDSGKINIESKAYEKNTALHLASVYGSQKVVHILLDNKADLLAKLSDNSIPLHAAAHGGHEEVISSLLKKDDKHIDTANDDDATPLYIAMQYDNRGAAFKLVESGAKIDIALSDNKTLLHVAAQRGHLTAVVNLLNAGITVNARDSDELIALSYAVKNNFLDIAIEMLDHGADVNFVGSDNKPLIHTLVDLHEYDALNMVEMFANYRAILNVADRNPPHNTFFHAVCAKGMMQVAQFLHSQGVRLDEKNKDGKTALDLAKENKQTEVVQYLESLKSKSTRSRRDVGEVEQFDEHYLDKEEVLDFSQNSFAKQVASSCARPVGLINHAIGSLVSALKSLPSQLSSLVTFGVGKASEHSSTGQSAFQSVQCSDLNGTLLLVDLLIRRHSGVRYVDTSLPSVDPQEARLFALQLVNQLDSALHQLAHQSGEDLMQLNLFDIYRTVEKLALSGQYERIERLMQSTAREACSNTQIEHGLIAKWVDSLWTQACSNKQNSEPNSAGVHFFSDYTLDQAAQNAPLGDGRVSKQNLI